MWRFLKRFRRTGPDFHYRILVVCKANITRSPFVEGLLRKKIDERFPERADTIGVASAGVEAYRNAAPDPVMRYLAQSYGVDLNRHASRGVTDRLVREADLILTLEEWHARQVRGRFRNSETKTFPLTMFGNSDLERTDWDIPDPTGREAETYDAFAEVADTETDRVLALLEGALQDTRETLVLIGMPGSGKSTAGRLLAERLDWEFLDTDTRIEEREGRTLQEIVDTEGYLRLRAIEEETLCGLHARDTVIATGGSAVYSTRAMTHLRNQGRIVWLDADPGTLRERVGDGADRGLARPPDQTLEDLMAERLPLYARWAEDVVSTEGTPEEVCGMLEPLVQRFHRE